MAGLISLNDSVDSVGLNEQGYLSFDLGSQCDSVARIVCFRMWPSRMLDLTSETN